jgi:phosphohistidine phosphatase SixA
MSRRISAGAFTVYGWNPGITEFADRLSADRRIDHMPTAAVVTMQVNLRDWTSLDWGQGLEVEFDYPKRSR